jgi:HK97 family phage prohead protease
MRFYWPIAKLDAEQRMVWGYASTEAEDDQGETVARGALSAALDDYMRFANIREMHQPSAVGVATEATVDDRGLYVAARIVDGEAWDKVVAGVYKGFSIGGRVTARDPADRRLITGLRLNEISLVDRPANPEAVFDCWKRAAAAADDVDYADPGYHPDGAKRYPLDSERQIRAAWAYIHQDDNARRYTPAQLALIRARIVTAWQARIDPEGPPAEHAAMEVAAGLQKLIGADLAALADTLAQGLTKFAGDIVPRLDALQKRVDDIAQTPLPPQTALRSYVGILKRDDGGGFAAEGDIVAALARMSDEERTLALIKAAHANPIITGRTPR